MNNLQCDPELWQNDPEQIATRFADGHEINGNLVPALAALIQEERLAARPYVRSCTDAQWATEPGIQDHVHAIFFNGINVSNICVGFNTGEGWVELILTAGTHDDGRPVMLPNRSRTAPLTVRLLGDVEVQMTGVLNGVAHQAYVMS